MEPDNKLGRWAALFVSAYSKGTPDADAAPRPTAPGIEYFGVTPAAGELLRAVDAGGVPAFVTGKLKQIAMENGVEAADGWTPNQIIEAIRSRARVSGPGDSGLAA